MGWLNSYMCSKLLLLVFNLSLKLLTQLISIFVLWKKTKTLDARPLSPICCKSLILLLWSHLFQTSGKGMSEICDIVKLCHQDIFIDSWEDFLQIKNSTVHQVNHTLYCLYCVKVMPSLQLESDLDSIQKKTVWPTAACTQSQY